MFKSGPPPLLSPCSSAQSWVKSLDDESFVGDQGLLLQLLLQQHAEVDELLAHCHLLHSPLIECIQTLDGRLLLSYRQNKR